MDDKFGPLVTCIFRAITIRNLENDVYPGFSPRITTTEKKRISGILSKAIYGKYLFVQHTLRSIHESHLYTLISIGCLYKNYDPL